jgi:integrase/recombinase XerD
MIEKEYVVTFGDGVFKELFLKFIQYKKGIGFKYGREVESALSKLNNKLNAYHMETLRLPKEIVEKLAERIPSEASATQAKRIGFLRHFAIFLNNMGHEAYVYPQLYNVKSNSSFSPYIFSHEQILPLSVLQIPWDVVLSHPSITLSGQPLCVYSMDVD